MTMPKSSGPESGVWKRARTLEGWARALFEGIDDAVFVHDLRGRILDANPAACRRLGYTREEFLKMTTREIDHPDFAKGFNSRLEKQMLEGGLRCEGKHRTKDGRTILVDINSSAIEFDGRPCVLAVMRDVTEQKEAERILRKQTQLLRSILNNMGDGVLVVDGNERLLVSNPVAHRLFGFSDKEGWSSVNWPPQDGLFLPDQITPFPPQDYPWTQALHGHDIDNVEMYVFLPGTKHGRWVSFTARPLREGNAIRGSIMVCRDVTQQKRAERRLGIQTAIARVFISEDSPETLEQFILTTMGQRLAWDVAILWLVDFDRDVLYCEAIWHRPSLKLEEFEKLARVAAFQRGQSLPGRVWDKATPLWLINIFDDPELEHIPYLKELGVNRAFAFPIWNSGTITGVVESFSRRQEVPNKETLSFAGTLGSHIGQLLERQRVERALRESEAFYHSLVENLPQNLFRKDREGRVTFANRRYCNLLGLTLKELVGKTDFDLFPAEVARKYRADDQKVLETGKPLMLVEEHFLHDGTKIYVEVIKTPIHDVLGNVIGTQGLFWDVTEKKRAEEALASSEKRYRQLTEATLDAIIVTDQNGSITLFNPAAEKLFGYQAKEVEGQPIHSLISFDKLGQKGSHSEKFLNLVGKTVEMEGYHKNGAQFPLELALTAIDPPTKGEPVGQTPIRYLGAIRDLTERNRMRSFLIKNEKLASIGLLSAGVAHEINNPLAFIGNNLAVLDRDLKGVMEILGEYEKDLDKMAEVAPESAQRIRDLSEEIDLDYIKGNLSRLLGRTREGVDRVARIVQSLRGLARTGIPQRQKASLVDLLDSSLEIIRNRIKRDNITIETHADDDHSVFCVPTQINQVLLNLLVNATQAIEEAKKKHGGKIQINIRRLEEEMCIEITDNGCGISPKNLPHLFDPFFTTKDVGEGTGLGLSITHNIIDGHGGRIEVDSLPGQGTTFRIFLPLTQE